MIYAELNRGRLCHFIGGMAFAAQHRTNIISIVARRGVDDDKGNNGHHKQHGDRREDAVCEETEHEKIQALPPLQTGEGGARELYYFTKPSPGAEPGLPGRVSGNSSFLDCLSFGTYTRSRMMLSSAQLYMKIGAPGATLAKRLLIRSAPG